MKNKFIKSSISVISIGLIAKILSMIVKIYTTRTYGIELMSIYSLVNPLMIFIITLVQLSLPISLSKIIAQNKNNKKDYLLSAYSISLTISLIIMFILIFFSEIISIKIFKNSLTKHSIMAIGVYAPLVTLTSLYKGYLIGKGKIEITSISQIIEEIARLLFILLSCSFFINKNNSYASMGIIVGMWIGEIFQMISLLLLNYKKNFKIFKILKDVTSNYNKKYVELLSISIPITFSRIITSFSFSIEPIIYTNIMLKEKYNHDFITESYGILQTYVNPILFLPSFFISSVSLILLPSLSKLYSEKKLKKSIELFKKSLLISLLIGFASSLIIYIFSKNILNILYKTDLGNNFIKLLAFPYILYYIESIMNTTLHCINKEKISLLISLFASLLRIILLFILIPIFGVIGIEIAMLFSILFVIIIDSIFIKKYLFLNI